MSELVLNNICKNYGRFTALNNITLHIKPGIFGLLGPNGAGKTTLMRILTTLLSPTSGEIILDNVNWKDSQEVRKIIGYLPQKFSMYKHVSIYEALNHIAVLKGISINRKQHINSVLEKVNLVEQRDRKIYQLSGGMIRRLGIAQAILGEPKIIIVDEPTAGLDPEERIRFRKLLREIERKSIIIISTHIVEDVEDVCETAAILRKGGLAAHGKLDDLRKEVAGKVWEKDMSEQQYHSMPDTLNIISTHRMGSFYKVRYLSDTQVDNASIVDPTLEDMYIFLMRLDV